MLVLLQSETDRVYITNYGARVVAWHTPDQGGEQTDIVLGFDSIDGYLNASESYHGATIGRYANRIANGAFSLDGKAYQVDRNLGGHTLHGGRDGWHSKIWAVVKSSDNAVTLRLIAPDGENGFAGEVTVLVTYTLAASSLQIDYRATTTRATVLSMTHHSFFNLNGEGSGSILEHDLHIDADHYTPVDTDCIPTGKVDMVMGTPLDFSSRKKMGQDIEAGHQQLINGAGYDHNYVVDAYMPGHLKYIARAEGDKSGIALACWSDKPGMQFYSGNHLNGKDIGKAGVAYGPRMAFCFEPQYFPDSPNQAEFPSTVLLPTAAYRSSTVYKCSVK
jgi:aldose 1-epimerase